MCFARSFLFGIVLLWGWASNAQEAWQASKQNLTGLVKDSSGQACSNAMISICGIHTKTKEDPLCAYSYPDYGRKTAVNADGQFVLESVDATVTFDLLIAGEGFKPRLLEKVDVLKGPVTASLEPLNKDKISSDKLFTGVIRDEGGNPVGGVLVTAYSYLRSDAQYPSIDSSIAFPTMTDREGRFITVAKQAVGSVTFIAKARSFAPLVLKNLAPGQEGEGILERGVTITGRLIREGKPIPHGQVGMVQVNRGAEDIFFGPAKVITDEQGVFVFQNVLGGVPYYLYGIMDSLRDVGALGSFTVKPGNSGTKMDFGSLTLQRGHILKGKIITDDGEPLPAHWRVSISRDAAWDQQVVEVSPTGEFTFHGLPNELFSFYLRLNDYQLSLENLSIDRLNEDHLIGRVDEDRTDLNILMERLPFTGERRQPPTREESQAWDGIKVYHEPLRGMPPEKK